MAWQKKTHAHFHVKIQFTSVPPVLHKTSDIPEITGHIKKEGKNNPLSSEKQSTEPDSEMTQMLEL